MERIIFGDNQFFGINHMSEAKAREQSIRFRNLSAVIDVLNSAHAAGIGAFMCTTHDRIRSVLEYAKRDGSPISDLDFYPSLPYAHKYANAVTEHGMLGALRTFTPDSGALSAALRGGRAVASKDVDELIRMLVDAEMSMFEGVSTPIVFLQNVVTDLLLGLHCYDAFEVFADHVRRKYGAEAGFITMNLPLLLEALGRVSLNNPIVCTNMNKIGFRMAGGPVAYEEALRTREARIIAMSVFASGAIEPREAIEWVCSRPSVMSISFGASSARNILATKALIDEHWVAAVKQDVASAVG